MECFPGPRSQLQHRPETSSAGRTDGKATRNDTYLQHNDSPAAPESADNAQKVFAPKSFLRILKKERGTSGPTAHEGQSTSPLPHPPTYLHATDSEKHDAHDAHNNKSTFAMKADAMATLPAPPAGSSQSPLPQATTKQKHHRRKRPKAINQNNTSNAHDQSPLAISEKLAHLGCTVSPLAKGKVSDGPPPQHPLHQPESQTPPTVGPWGVNSKQSKGDNSNEYNSKRGKPPNPNNNKPRPNKGPVPRSQQWPTNKDIPKADPKRWAPRSNSAASSVQSSGWLTKVGDANEGTFPEYRNASLADWAGGLQPPPLDWDSRPAFRDYQSTLQIEQWLDKSEEGFTRVYRAVSIRPSQGFHFAKLESDGDTLDAADNPMGDLVPRYWIPEKIDNKSPLLFWKTFLAEKAPCPVNEDDLRDACPWWNLYQSNEVSFLKQHQQPRIAGIEPDEDYAEQAARKQDFGSNWAIEKWKCSLKPRHGRRKIDEDEGRKFRELALAGTMRRISGPKIFKPAINIHLRFATRDDMPGIRDIYNHYVNFSVVTPETEPRTEWDLNARWRSILSCNLPFIVACERGPKFNIRRNRMIADNINLPDKVVGFALAEDKQDLYKGTVKIEVYATADHYMHGIAKCLLDKLLALLDPSYAEVGDYRTDGLDVEHDEPAHAIRNIIINYPHGAQQKDKLECMQKWLTGWPGFKHAATLEGIGSKLDKSVDVAIFHKTIGAVQGDIARPSDGPKECTETSPW